MTAQEDDEKVCKLCGVQSADLPESGRCNECQSLKTRLYRHFAKKGGGDERKHWDSLTKGQRQVFYSQWHGQVGIDLKAAINETVFETTKESKHETSTLSFTWMDENQLIQKYKGREDQLENIKKNADSMKCKIREVTLWAHPKYSSNEVNCSSSSRGRERELVANEVSRPAKRPRVDRLQIEPGKLTEKQVGNLVFEKHKLEEFEKKIKWTIFKASLDPLSDGIKKKDRDQLHAQQQKLRNTILALDTAITQANGEFKEVKKEIAAVRSATNPYYSKLKHAVADAEKDISQEVAASIKGKMDEYEAERKKEDYVAELIDEKVDEPETIIMTQDMNNAVVENHW